MASYNVTEHIEKSVLNAWNDCVKDTENKLFIDDILEKYMSDDNDLFLNASGILLYRFFQKNLSGIVELDKKRFEDNVETLSQLLCEDKRMDFYRISKKKCDWSDWLTKGFTPKQRLDVFKIAICGKMEEKELLKLLTVVDGETINIKDPTDVIYYYAFKRGYNLVRANKLNDRYNNERKRLKPTWTNASDNDFLENLVNEFKKTGFYDRLFSILKESGCNRENNNDYLQEKNAENTSKDYLREFFEAKLHDKVLGMSYDETTKYLVDYISYNYPEVLKKKNDEKSDADDKKYIDRIGKWLTVGIKTKKEAFRLGLSIPYMDYAEFIGLLKSIDGNEYDFSNKEYCVYYYCKKKNYDIKRADSLLDELFYRENSIGLTQTFKDFFDSNLNEDVADDMLIRMLVESSSKMNNASIHNIARFARLSQYVVAKYDGFKGVNVKMNYNRLFPQGAQLYKAVYGEPIDDYVDGQKTHNKGEGTFYLFVAKYFKDYGNRLKDKYDILMGNRKIDLIYNGVKRMEVLTLLYPFVLEIGKRITKDDLLPFVCDNNRPDKAEWEAEIQKTWDEFDNVMDELQTYLQSEIKLCSEKVNEVKKNEKQAHEALKNLLKAYEKAFNMVLKEFGFMNIYPPYLGDRFFFINLLANKPFEGENNIARSARDFSMWDPDYISPAVRDALLRDTSLRDDEAQEHWEYWYS